MLPPAELGLPGGATWMLARAEGKGPQDTPGKPKPGGHCRMPMLPVGGGTAKAKPPREFPFWKLGTSLFMTFSRGGERGTGWVYGSDTICVMTSAPTRPLSSLNSWEGPGWAWNAGCRGGWGRGSLESGPGPCWPSEGLECRAVGRQRQEWPGIKEAMTTSWLPKGRDRACWAHPLQLPGLA